MKYRTYVDNAVTQDSNDNLSGNTDRVSLVIVFAVAGDYIKSVSTAIAIPTASTTIVDPGSLSNLGATAVDYLRL